MFCLEHQSVDSTDEPCDGPQLGRLVNHGERRERNAKMKMVVVDGKPSLCLFAIRDIKSGEELLYDYGMNNLPWNVKVINVHSMECS